MKTLLFTFCIFFNNFLFAQALTIISTPKAYKKLVKLNPQNELVNIKKIIPSIIIDLKYATSNNFTKQQLYKNATTTYLRKDAAIALQAVQAKLQTLGYGLKVYDAYRPYSATVTMWNLIQNEDYVANPKNGSGHNRGTSIDLTLIDLTNGKELDMGTGFDNFTDSAWHKFTPQLPITIQKNRATLLTVIEKYGFKKLESEWWHYSWVSTQKYEVMDLGFGQLRNLVK